MVRSDLRIHPTLETPTYKSPSPNCRSQGSVRRLLAPNHHNIISQTKLLYCSQNRQILTCDLLSASLSACLYTSIQSELSTWGYHPLIASSCLRGPRFFDIWCTDYPTYTYLLEDHMDRAVPTFYDGTLWQGTPFWCTGKSKCLCLWYTW